MSVNWAEGATGVLTAGGKSLEYACFGPAPDQAPTIVMLHEGLGCVALWRDVPQKLAAATGLGVFVYSRAGYGTSEAADLPRPLDYMHDEALEVLPQVLDAFGFQSGVLMGHSDGASISAIYAGSVNDFRVRGLVLIAPHFFTEEVGLTAIAQARDSFATSDMKARLGKYHTDPEHSFRGWNEAWLNPDFKAWDIAEVIEYFRVPTLAIQGRQDQYGTLAQIEEIETRSYAPVDTVILEECRHSPHIDQSQAVIDAVAEFCAHLVRIENESVKIA